MVRAGSLNIGPMSGLCIYCVSSYKPLIKVTKAAWRRQTKKKRDDNKKCKKSTLRKVGLEPATSHSGFVGDRITRGRSIQPRHLECRACSFCLYKAHSERGRSASSLKSKRDPEQPAFDVRKLFLLMPPTIVTSICPSKSPWP